MPARPEKMARSRSGNGLRGFLSFFRRTSEASPPESDEERYDKGPSKWSMGVLNDEQTVEVPGALDELRETDYGSSGLTTS
jgi:hypothetical protein